VILAAHASGVGTLASTVVMTGAGATCVVVSIAAIYVVLAMDALNAEVDVIRSVLTAEMLITR